VANPCYEDPCYFDSLVHFICAVLAVGNRIDFSLPTDLAHPFAIQDHWVLYRDCLQVHRQLTHVAIPNSGNEIKSLLLADPAQVRVLEIVGIFQAIAQHTVEGAVAEQNNTRER